MPALSIAGDVFGMHTTEVKPRARRGGAGGDVFLGGLAGFAEVDMQVNQAGANDQSLASNFSMSRGACLAASAPTAAILPLRIKISAVVSRRLAGSITRPPVRSSEFIGAGG